MGATARERKVKKACCALRKAIAAGRKDVPWDIVNGTIRQHRLTLSELERHGIKRLLYAYSDGLTTWRVFRHIGVVE